jgi:hypothetical protein
VVRRGWRDGQRRRGHGRSGAHGGRRARIAQTLITDYGIADVLYPLMDEICSLLGLTGAGVLLKGEGEDVLRFAAAPDETITRIDALQAELGEGPCLTAYEEAARELVEGRLELDAHRR